MASDDIHLSWAHGTFTVVRAGAMCAPAEFVLPDGRRVQPFAIAEWQDDGSKDFRDLPPLLKRLRGDWACVPFGMPHTRVDLPTEWAPRATAGLATGNWFHGPGANENWTVTETGEGSVTLMLDYPIDHPISRVKRRIHGDPSGARIHFDLEVLPRESCRLPVGVHPVMRLPEEIGAAKLVVEGANGVFTYPVDAEPNVSQLSNGIRFDALDRARWADNSELDLSRHPLPRQTEEIVLVAGVTGRAHLEYESEGWRVSVIWDPAAFGACNLWISNGGRGFYPWNHRFRGLGIEPVSAPFDLGVDVAISGGGPLTRAGIPLAVSFVEGQVWRTRHTVEVSAT